MGGWHTGKRQSEASTSQVNTGNVLSGLCTDMAAPASTPFFTECG